MTPINNVRIHCNVQKCKNKEISRWFPIIICTVFRSYLSVGQLICCQDVIYKSVIKSNCNWWFNQQSYKIIACIKII